MKRRQVLAAVGTACGTALTTGCLGVLPTEEESGREYPSGTVIVDNTGSESLGVRVTTAGDERDVSIATTVGAGERAVEREFVDASDDEHVTLAARIGPDGEPVTFEFLPAGEVATLTIENQVEASATWTATVGS